MSQEFVRSVKDINDIKNVEKYTNSQNDLLSTKNGEIFVRNQQSYHCLTDNIKSINGKTVDKNNSLTLDVKGSLSVDGLTITGNSYTKEESDEKYVTKNQFLIIVKSLQLAIKNLMPLGTIIGNVNNNFMPQDIYGGKWEIVETNTKYTTWKKVE